MHRVDRFSVNERYCVNKKRQNEASDYANARDIYLIFKISVSFLVLVDYANLCRNCRCLQLSSLNDTLQYSTKKATDKGSMATIAPVLLL